MKCAGWYKWGPSALRRPYYSHVLEKPPAMDWFEVISENFMVDAAARWKRPSIRRVKSLLWGKPCAAFASRSNAADAAPAINQELRRRIADGLFASDR